MTPYWLSRLFLALEVLVGVVIVSWFEDASLTGAAIHAAGEFGWVLVLALGASCLLALADVGINDSPGRMCMPLVMRMRHVGFLSMGLLLASIGVLVAFAAGYSTLLLFYWLNAAMAVTVAFLDAFSRLRKPCP